MNYAIIGCGLIGKKRVTGMPAGAKLIVACDTHLARAEELVKLAKSGRTCADFNDAVADPQAARSDVEGWRRETAGRFSVQRFGGDRSYVQREREALTALIGNHLSVMVGALARSAPVPR